jgi:DNA-directed RNA polymerase specialized sigma24 family protein
VTDHDLNAASDGELVAAVREGDRLAYGVLYERHHQLAWRIACNSAESFAEAEGAVIDGFTRVFGTCASDGDVPFHLCVAAGVRQAALAAHPSPGRRPGRSVLARLGRLSARSPQNEVDLRGGDCGADGQSVLLTPLELALDAFHCLPETWRIVLWLTEVEAMTLGEAAFVVGIKPSAVARLRRRASRAVHEAALAGHVQAPLAADCRSTLARLRRGVDTQASTLETGRIGSHLEDCVPCFVAWEQMREAQRFLLAAVVPVPEDLGPQAQRHWLDSNRNEEAWGLGDPAAEPGRRRGLSRAVPMALAGSLAGVALFGLMHATQPHPPGRTPLAGPAPTVPAERFGALEEASPPPTVRNIGLAGAGVGGGRPADSPVLISPVGANPTGDLSTPPAPSDPAPPPAAGPAPSSSAPLTSEPPATGQDPAPAGGSEGVDMAGRLVAGAAAGVDTLAKAVESPAV